MAHTVQQQSVVEEAWNDEDAVALLGQTVDRFRLIRLLGSGSVGHVFEAEHVMIGTRVAIKVIRAHVAQDPSRLEAYYLDAKTVGQISHRSIVDVYDVLATADGRPSIVMELLEGISFEQYLLSHRVARPGALIGWMTQICDVLSAAHGYGVVHRDLKPSNLFVTGDGRVKVLDFGAARFMERALIDEPFGLGSQRNVSGRFGNGIPYLSPEQAAGLVLDARSDLFALGVIAYELLSGFKPFVGKNLIELGAEHRRAVAPLQAPVGVARIVMKCLAIWRDQRWASASDLKDAFATLLGDDQPTGPWEPPTLRDTPNPEGRVGQA